MSKELMNRNTHAQELVQNTNEVALDRVSTAHAQTLSVKKERSEMIKSRTAHAPERIKISNGVALNTMFTAHTQTVSVKKETKRSRSAHTPGLVQISS